MMAFPAVQILTNDPATNPQMVTVAQTQGIGLVCPNGVTQNLDMVLAPASSNVALPFPNGATAAVFIYIFALNITDLVVKVGSSQVALPVLPQKQGILLYGLTSAQITVSSVLGGNVQIAIGG